MKDEEALPVTKREPSDSVIFGKGKYKFWALAAILLLASWSMFTGTVSLSGTLNSFSHDIHAPIHDDLDVLEMEEREKVVRHMWDVYSNNRRIRLPRFWQDAFEAAYVDLTSDVPEVRDSAINEISKMSVRSFDFQSPPATHSTVIVSPFQLSLLNSTLYRALLNLNYLCLIVLSQGNDGSLLFTKLWE
ncbi:hypothetical protein RJT34_30424 [Clitoria ternatea]|uniref:Uncharacterized protein n=1 Tax=Clitoria ternatea TaxID=43366 RepID=A0AAN9ET98_CLITE